LTATGAVVEIFKDHARIIERAAILGDQHGNLAERILLAQRVVRIDGVGGFDAYIAIQAKQRQRDAHLAAERRGRRGTQDHHRCIIGANRLRRNAQTTMTARPAAADLQGISNAVRTRTLPSRTSSLRSRQSG
jgi:hypothetical protein